MERSGEGEGGRGGTAVSDTDQCPLKHGGLRPRQRRAALDAWKRDPAALREGGPALTVTSVCTEGQTVRGWTPGPGATGAPQGGLLKGRVPPSDLLNQKWRPYTAPTTPDRSEGRRRVSGGAAQSEGERAPEAKMQPLKECVPRDPAGTRDAQRTIPGQREPDSGSRPRSSHEKGPSC